MNKPNFFIVGAPKCGTTAMNDYLNQHPDVFMAAKELHYFGKDLKIKTKLSEAEYLQYFLDAGNTKVIGEASVWYLFSKTAAEEIKKFSPGARILIMLRDPVQVIHSLHSQHLYDGNEDVFDFERALNLEQARKEGNKLPNSVGFTQLPGYVDSVLFYKQVERYITVFGREKVSIILYDDFVANTKEIVAKTFQFLDLDDKFQIQIDIINPNKQIKFFYLHRVLKNPNPSLKKLFRGIVPSKKIRHSIMARLFKMNIKIKERKKLRDSLNSSIRNLLADDIHKLSRLIDRDLSKWLE